MTSVTKQAHLLLRNIPLSGTTIDALASRCASNWSKVEVWAGNGNADAVKRAGAGRLAICAWLAAKLLADDARMEPFQKSSGLSPKAFADSAEELLAAIQSSRASVSSSNPSTPRRNGIYRNFEPSSSSSSQQHPSPTSQDQTPEARAKRAREFVTRATLASSNNNSPLGKRRRTGEDASAPPSTPTSRTLRDRSSIKEAHIFDPSAYDITPTKKTVVFDASSINQASRRPRQVDEVVPASPSKERAKKAVAGKRRHKVLVGYPAGEPLQKADREYLGEWNSSRCKSKIQQCIAAVEKCRDTTGWEQGGQLLLEL